MRVRHGRPLPPVRATARGTRTDAEGREGARPVQREPRARERARRGPTRPGGHGVRARGRAGARAIARGGEGVGSAGCRAAPTLQTARAFSVSATSRRRFQEAGHPASRTSFPGAQSGSSRGAAPQPDVTPWWVVLNVNGNRMVNTLRAPVRGSGPRLIELVSLPRGRPRQASFGVDLLHQVVQQLLRCVDVTGERLSEVGVRGRQPNGARRLLVVPV